MTPPQTKTQKAIRALACPAGRVYISVVDKGDCAHIKYTDNKDCIPCDAIETLIYSQEDAALFAEHAKLWVNIPRLRDGDPAFRRAVQEVD